MCIVSFDPESNMGAVAKKNLAEAPIKIKVPYDGFRQAHILKAEGFARLMLAAPEKCGKCDQLEMHDHLEVISLDVNCGLRCKDAHRRGNRCKKELDAEAWEQREKAMSSAITPFLTGSLATKRIKDDEVFMIGTPPSVSEKSVDWSKVTIEKERLSPNRWAEEYMTQPGVVPTTSTSDHAFDAASYGFAGGGGLLRKPVKLGVSRDKPLTATDDAW